MRLHPRPRPLIPISKRDVMKKLLTVAFVALMAFPAHAAQEGAALSPFAGNLGNAVWTLVIFVIVVFVLGKFAWGPVLGLLRERETFIHRSLSDAKRDRDEAEARLKEYAAKLQTAHAEAVTIVEGARADAERLRQELREKAKSEAENLIKNAERQIQLETARALQQIRSEAVDLSVMIASKLIGRNLTKEDNERLIEEALKQVSGPQH
jgi:F-type H+-transporting ATPase subunit b